MTTMSTQVDLDQHQLITAAAKNLGLTISEYLRYSALQCANHNFTLTKIQESNAELLRKLRVDLAKTANFIAENMKGEAT
ncbi:MAG: plasmid mobilization protein [Pseudomonadota bacterium]